jgi:hypothetical protein
METHQPISPEQATKLRVIYRVQHEFLIEHNALPDEETVSRRRIRDAAERLCHSERTAMRERVSRNLQRVETLMDGQRKQFDEPAVRHADLHASVTIPEFRE